MDRMTALEQLRAAQHDDQLTASDIRMTVWLAEVQRDAVIADQAAHMQPAEIALMRPLRRTS